MHGSTRSERAIGSVVSTYLRRHGALAIQVPCATATEGAAVLSVVLAAAGARRLVLVVPETFDLPEAFASFTILRIASGPKQAFGAAEFAAALDRLPQIDGALLLLLFGRAPPLPPHLAPVAPSGIDLGPWLVARLREAACGGESAG